MKRTICLLLTALMVMGTLIACQETPETPLVVGKDLDNLMEKASQFGSIQHYIPEMLRAPERMQMQLTSKGGKLIVNVDAAVSIPQVDQLPATRVGHGHFTEEDARRFADVLLKDATPLDPANIQPTKAMLQKDIEALQRLKQSGELDKYESVQEIDDAIAQLMQEAVTASEAYVPYAHQFQPLNPDNYISLMAALDDGMISSLFVEYESIEYYKDENRRAALSNIFTGTPASGEDVVQEDDLTEETGFTPEEAFDLAMQTIEKLEIENLVCSGRRAFTFPKDGFSAYEFIFTRTITGVPISYTNDDGNEFNPDAIAPTWTYENVRLLVDETGVSNLVYRSPYEILDTVTPNCKLLPFSDIQNIFVRMLPVVNNFYDEYEKKCEMDVREAKLGLMRIKERNSKDTGLIIPVWDFMGTYTAEGILFDDDYISLLTINAIDGSIVDRGLGY